MTELSLEQANKMIVQVHDKVHRLKVRLHNIKNGAGTVHNTLPWTSSPLEQAVVALSRLKQEHDAIQKEIDSYERPQNTDAATQFRQLFSSMMV